MVIELTGVSGESLFDGGGHERRLNAADSASLGALATTCQECLRQHGKLV